MKKNRILTVFWNAVIVFSVFATSCFCFYIENQAMASDDFFAKHVIKNVPFVYQKTNYCVPASVEMVFKFYGINEVTQDDIAESITEKHGKHKGTH